MSRTLTFIGVLTVLVLFLGLGIFLGMQHTPNLPAEAYAACAVSMDEVIAGGLGDVYNFEGVEEFDEPEFHYLVRYSVDGDELVEPVLLSIPADLKDEQQDSALHTEAWNIFTELVPLEDRSMVAQFNVFTDARDNTLAAVDQLQQNPSQWMLEVDVADLQDRDAFLFTLIHEYAHILTLNSTQVEPDIDILRDPYNLELQAEKDAQCSTYFVGNGCSYADSYINVFYNRFWVDIHAEWKEIDAMQHGTQDFLPYYNALYDFYQENRDQFVGDYSVTHPAEDIAEAFTHFVFSPKPVGNTIREQKIRFFYEYPELVQLREEILSGACELEP